MTNDFIQKAIIISVVFYTTVQHILYQNRSQIPWSLAPVEEISE